MAKELNMQFSGRIGPLVGCYRDGKYYYRSRPVRMKQSSSTKRMASLFGQAAAWGRVMRLQLAPAIPNPKDKGMQLRLEARIRQWLSLSGALPPQATGDVPFINHFNFNLSHTLAEKLGVQPVLQADRGGEVLLQLPAFVPARQVKAPAGTTHLQLVISGAAMLPGSETGYSCTTSISMAYDEQLQPAQSIRLALPAGGGQLLLAVLQLKFGIQQAGGIDYEKQAAASVAAIVGAVYL